MNPIILKNTIDVHNITLLDTERYNQDHYIWPIQYNNSNMCIQSCYLNLVKYNKIYNNISLSTYHKPVQSSKKNFITLIRDIDKIMIRNIALLKKKLQYRKKIMYKKSYVIQKKYIYYNYFLQQYNKQSICSVYDEHKDMQSLDYIEPGCDVYSILWLKNLWLKNGKAGLNYTIIQLKVYKPIIYMNKCLIIEDTDIFTQEDNKTITPVNTYEDIDPLYKIYFKMKKMGVPIQAIQMKMKLAGHDPTMLTKSIQSSTHSSGIVSISNHTSTRMSPLDLLQGIKNKRLKKVRKKNTTQDKKTRILRKWGFDNRRNGIPTLDEIVRTRNRLKKIR